ncbi:MAG: hypothetical protein ACLTDR_00060 [Adlercreutzia equolifaciens]
MDVLRRSVFFALAVVLGFLLLELPWNGDVFAIPQRYVIDNLLILGLGCAITFLAGQRTRASLAAFVGLCLMWGTANFFIIAFKGQPIVPADLFALGTAASVAGGYSLLLTGRLAFCWALFAAYCIALAKLCPQRKRARWDIAANMLAAALLVCLGAMQYQAIDIKKRLRGDCGRMGRARLLRHPGHRALLPLAGPRADAQASGGLLRRGRGRHPGPLRRGSADGNGRHGGRVPLARHNGQPKLNGAHHWRCSAGTARSTPLRRPQRHRHHERDVLRSLRIPRP